MVIESELDHQKFYFVCHHEFQVFHFYVMCLCIDENVAKKYMYNIAIQDGSRVNMYLILCSVFWRMPISDRYTPKVLFDTYIFLGRTQSRRIL